MTFPTKLERYAGTSSPISRSFDLLCPGPVNVHPEVAAALTSFEFGHREEELSLLFDAIRDKLLAVADLDPVRYGAVVITGSGTAANEAVLSSAVAEDDVVLVLSNGEFGERLAEISGVHNRTVHVRHDWAEPLDLARIDAMIAEHRPALVAMVHHETSTGMLNPVERVGELARRHGTKLFVDMVSSFSADSIDLARAGVTFVSSSAGKAIGSYPGLAFVIGLHEAFRTLPDRAAHSHYLDLRRYYNFAQHKRQTPNTPALPLMLALERALGLALEEGLPRRLQRLGALATHVRNRVEALGLRTLLRDGPMSNVLTSVLLPEEVPFEEFRQALRERGFVIYGGKGPFQDKMFQVSTIGAVDEALLDGFFDALAAVLAEVSTKATASAVA